MNNSSKYILNFLKEDDVTKLYSEKELKINNFLKYNSLQIFTTENELMVVDKNSNERTPFFHKKFESVDSKTDSLKIYETGDDIFLYNMRENNGFSNGKSLELNVVKIERVKYSTDYEMNGPNSLKSNVYEKKIRNVHYMCQFIETVKINTEQTVIKNVIINNEPKFCWSDEYLTVYLTNKINVYQLKTLDLVESINFDYGSVQKCTKIVDNKFLCLKRIIQQKNELTTDDRFLSGFDCSSDYYSIVWQVFEIEIGVSTTLNSTNCKLIYSSSPLIKRTTDEKFYFDTFFTDQKCGFCFYVNGTHKIYVNGLLVPIGSDYFFGEIEKHLDIHLYTLKGKTFLIIMLEDKIISLDCQNGTYKENERVIEYKIDELYMEQNETNDDYTINYKIDKILIDNDKNVNYLLKISDYYRYKDYECFTNVFDYKILIEDYETILSNYDDKNSFDTISKHFKYMESLNCEEIFKIRDLKHMFKISNNYKNVLEVLDSYFTKCKVIRSIEVKEIFDKDIIEKEEKKLFENCRLKLIDCFKSKLSGNIFYNKDLNIFETPYLHSDGWCYNKEDFEKLKLEDGAIKNYKEVDTKLIKAMNILQLDKINGNYEKEMPKVEDLYENEVELKSSKLAFKPYPTEVYDKIDVKDPKFYVEDKQHKSDVFKDGSEYKKITDEEESSLSLSEHSRLSDDEDDECYHQASDNDSYNSYPHTTDSETP